jgi:hypothetical protein
LHLRASLLPDLIVGKALSSMENYRFEFFKLDRADMRALFWIMDNAPESIESWTQYVNEDYSRRKGIEINQKKLLNEIVSPGPESGTASFDI